MGNLKFFIIVGILLLAGIVAYEAFPNLFGGSDPDTDDPETGESNGLANRLDNDFFPEQFPGGGEVHGTSETYTGAASETLRDPLGVMKSILGFD